MSPPTVQTLLPTDYGRFREETVFEHTQRGDGHATAVAKGELVDIPVANAYATTACYILPSVDGRQDTGYSNTNTGLNGRKSTGGGPWPGKDPAYFQGDHCRSCRTLSKCS